MKKSKKVTSLLVVLLLIVATAVLAGEYCPQCHDPNSVEVSCGSGSHFTPDEECPYTMGCEIGVYSNSSIGDCSECSYYNQNFCTHQEWDGYHSICLINGTNICWIF